MKQIAKTYNPGKGRPREKAVYLSPAEIAMVKRLTDGTAEKTPYGILSFAEGNGTPVSSGSVSDQEMKDIRDAISRDISNAMGTGGTGSREPTGPNGAGDGGSGYGGTGNYGGGGGNASREPTGPNGAGDGGSGYGYTGNGYGALNNGGGGLGPSPGYGSSYNAPVMGSSDASRGVLKDLMDSAFGRFDQNPYTQNMDKLVRTLAGEAMPGGYGAGAIANSMVNRARNTDLYKRGLVKSEYEAIGDPNYNRAGPDTPQYKNALHNALGAMSDPQSIPSSVRFATDYNADALAKQKGLDGTSYYGNTFGNFNPNAPSPMTVAQQTSPMFKANAGIGQEGAPSTMMASNQGNIAPNDSGMSPPSGMGQIAPSGIGQMASASPGMVAPDGSSAFATPSGETAPPATMTDSQPSFWDKATNLVKAGYKTYSDANKKIANFPGGPATVSALSRMAQAFGSLHGYDPKFQNIHYGEGNTPSIVDTKVAEAAKPAPKPNKKPRKPYRKDDRYQYPRMVNRPYTLIG